MMDVFFILVALWEFMLVVLMGAIALAITGRYRRIEREHQAVLTRLRDLEEQARPKPPKPQHRKPITTPNTRTVDNWEAFHTYGIEEGI